MKKIYFPIILGLIAFQCQLPEPQNTAANPASQSQPAAEKEEPKPKSNWSYSEDTDKMSNEKQFFATSTSTNTIEFKFPYQGGSTFQLILRNMGKKNEILVGVSKGQFMPSIMESETVRVKFDDEPPFNVTYNSAADASTDVIFLSSYNKLISKLKTAKKVMIEAPFFDAGRQIIYFDIEGLVWDH